MDNITEIATIRSKTYKYIVCFSLHDVSIHLVCNQDYIVNDNCIDEMYLYGFLPYPEYMPFNAITFVHQRK